MRERPIRNDDLNRIKEIHARYYQHEFDLPNFTKHFINVYAIVDDNDKIISVGGIRPILEVVALTDYSIPTRARIEALNYMRTISAHIADQDGFDEIHAFVMNPNWEVQLKKRGFANTRGTSLVFKV